MSDDWCPENDGAYRMELAARHKGSMEEQIRALQAENERLRDALRLIELLGYREGEDFGWINAHMRGVATSAIEGQDLSHYWRLFPKHRAKMGDKP